MALALKLSQSEKIPDCVNIKYVHVLCICEHFTYNLYIFHIYHFKVLSGSQVLAFFCLVI